MIPACFLQLKSSYEYLQAHTILSKIKYHIFGLFKVNDGRQELPEKCLWNEKHSNTNDGKSFFKLSVQIYTPLKENICMEKIQCNWKNKYPCVQEGIPVTLENPSSMYLSTYALCSSWCILLCITPTWVFAFSKYRMYTALPLNKDVCWNIQTLFFLKITQSANYGAKQVVSTHGLTAPINNLVFIQWPAGVICPLCIMETWKMMNRGHFPTTRNAVHCPGIMGIFPTCSGKMLHGKLSSTANETWQQWTSFMFEKQSLKHSEFTW